MADHDNTDRTPRVRTDPSASKKKLGESEDRPNIFLAGPVGKGREVQAPDELNGDPDIDPDDLEIDAEEATVTVEEAVEHSDLTREEISNKLDIPKDELDNTYLFLPAIAGILLPDSIPGSGVVAEQIVEKFMNITDFVDPVSLHDDGGDGGLFDFSPDADINLKNEKWWNDDGTFNESRYRGSVITKIDDKNPVDDILAGIVTGDPLEGIWDALMDYVKKAILSSDGVFVHHKGDHPQFGTAMEMQFAYEHDIPVAVYNGGAEDGVMVGKYADGHADYVTTNPNWAVSYLQDNWDETRGDPNDAQRENDDYKDYEVPDEHKLEPEAGA